MVAAGCGGGSPVTGELDTFPTGTIVLGDEEWTVAVAATPALRRQGLRGVEHLGDLDGMLFVFPEDTTASFTMRETLMPIDIAFFSASGALVDRLEMVPCRQAACPGYRAGGPFRYAVETEAGGFAGLGDLVLDPGL
jgi:uncharacterized membrane protein (UPF0127 family)